MYRNTVKFVIAAALGGFIGGFWLANSINRSAINSLATPGGVSSNVAQQPAANEDLSDEELLAKIAEADRNPRDFSYQKDLGIALYKYAAAKQDTNLFRQSIRVLERANSLNAKDFDVLVALGNAHFDIGFYEKSATSFQTARDVYTRALALKPDDADVKTDFALTYFLQEPPAYDKAAAGLNKVMASNPTHQRSMQFLVRTYVKQNKLADAEKTLARMRELNSSNPVIPELSGEISAARNGVAP